MQNIQSLVVAPLRRDRKLIGFTGIDNPRIKSAQVDRLAAIGDYITVLLTRRNLDAKVSEESKAMRAIMNGIPGGFVRMRLENAKTIVPVYYSQGFRSLVDMDDCMFDETFTHDIFDGIHSDDMTGVSAAVDTLCTAGEIRNIVFRLRCGSNGYVPVIVFARNRKSDSGKTFLNIYYSPATR